MADLETQASHGEVERTKVLQDIQWAGTGLPEEMCEIECHLRELIESGYPYLFMENYLMQMGYGANRIRQGFRCLTGVDATHVVNIGYVMTPGNIPRFNLGWGKARNTKDEWYFVMPQGDWFILCRQEGDRIREQTGKYFTLDEALDAAEKKVVKLERWDPPVREHKGLKLSKDRLYKQANLFAQVSQYGKFYDHLKNVQSSDERKALIDQAFESNMIGPSERSELLKALCADDMEEQVTKDTMRKRTDDAMAKPLKDETGERTPQQFFERQKMEQKYSTVYADVVDAITKHVFESNANIKEFDIKIRAIKYNVIDPAGSNTPTQSDEQDVMNANAWIAVLLDCVDKRSSAPYNTKLGMVVFEVIGEEIASNDTLKGEDNRQYALTDDGLKVYFSAERAHATTAV